MKICLIGGLGNQLFQVAQGLAIEKVTGRRICFDTGLIAHAPQAREIAVDDLVPDRLIASTAWVMKAITATSVIPFNPLVKVVGDTRAITKADEIRYVRVLVGYFQELALVDSVSTSLLDLFKQSIRFAPFAYGPVVDQIGIHVRLGDYASDPNARGFHGLTSPDYYVHAAEVLRKASGIRTIQIVSDNSENAERLIAADLRRRGFEVEIGSSSATAQEDLSMLANCSNLVCSNSTFSWWAGWMASRRHNSLVVVPSPWFSKKSKAERLLFDPNWIVIERDIDHSS